MVTPDGLPLAYEVLAGNTADCKTLRMFLDKIEQQYGRARRVWIMDRGIPTEAVLAEMRASDPPVQYLVGTPKGRLSRLEKDLLAKPWQQAREGVQVKLLAADSELYIFAESEDRVTKERAMRQRQMKWLWKRLRELAAMEISREEMLMKLGAAPSWHEGEVRPTSKPKEKGRKYLRTCPDPFLLVTAQMREWFDLEPWRTSRELLERLQREQPDIYPDKLLRTRQRRVKVWRRENAHQLVFGGSARGYHPAQSPLQSVT